MTDLTTLLTTWADAERAGDAETTDRLLTDDFVGVGPVAFQLSKEPWLPRLRGGDLPSHPLGLPHVSSREYSDSAVTVARWNARGTAQGHPIPEATRVTLVSVKDDGDWRLAGIHFSFIAGTPGAPGMTAP